MRHILTAVLSLVLSSNALASQKHLHAPFEPTGSITPSPSDSSPSPLSETIVSILSASKEHTILLHLLQRSKCIPMLAHIGNATLFAPTDKAWNDWADAHRPSGPEGLYPTG